MTELDMDKAPNKIDKENRMVLEMLSNYLMNAPDGIDMYLKMKEFEPVSPNTTFMYWIEKSMRCYL